MTRRGLAARLEHGLAFLIFGIVEICLALSAPRRYRNAVRRARGYGRVPFFAYPRSADEKFFWRKSLDHNPDFVRLSDKYEMRAYLAETGLDLQMAPILWSGFSAEALPASCLSGDVMVKTSHDCGANFPRWGAALPRPALMRRLNASLGLDHSRRFGEWAYKHVTPRVIAEARIGDDTTPISDVKVYTFGRRIERIVHIQDRPDARYGEVFEPDGAGGFNRLTRLPAVCSKPLDIPLEGVLTRALALSRDLGAPFDHMRVDFIACGDALYLGEMTVYNLAGIMTDGGEDPDAQISRAWDLRRAWRLRTRAGGPLMQFYLALLYRALDRANAASDLPPA